MTIVSFQFSSILGIWLIGPLGIVLVSLFVLVMCFWRVRTNSVMPESLMMDTKNLFFHHSQFMRMGCNCANHMETNKCSKLWIKPLKSFHNKRQQIPPKLCKELGLLQNMHHTNINPLIGAMVEDGELFLITPYCIKGSLQEILSDISITFRKPVIISLIQDLICGLTYIHHSSIKCHGRLKSSNCLVNSCLQLRIADFGINRIRELTPNRESTPPLIDRLWLAPEQLRLTNYSASWQADIYAFSIILHEIIHRQGPFNITSTPVDLSFILDQIGRKPSSDDIALLFRPKIMDNQNLEFGCPFYIRNCLEDCWRESPKMRPNADEIFCRLSIMKNEMYTPIVSTKSDDGIIALLQQEKENKSKLLSNIIPSHAATQLVNGLRVKPQLFDSVTLLFTNIANFREISETSTPHQVNMLNDLYTIFDSIVQEYHVYKVETVKDTYFVASGLFPSDVHHSSEAATLALDLLNSLQNYRTPHSPHRTVLLRLGMHLGPVAAGVIGLDKPRYCLFGDTVNTTSRLSTTGEPSRIHISSECHLVLARKGGFITRERGLVYLKGKGMRKTYWLIGTDQS